MKVKSNFLLPSISIIIFLLLSVSAYTQPTSEFQARRIQVLEKMKPNSILVLHSEYQTSIESEAPRFGGIFYYLTGINEPNVYLVLSKGESDSDTKEILFLEENLPGRANWDAMGYGIEGAKSKLGFKEARSNKDFESFFEQALIQGKELVYFNISKTRPGSFLSYYDQFFNRVKKRGADFKIESPESIITPMLATKSPAELDVIRKAVDITAAAHLAAQQSMEPGMFEYQIEALIKYVYKVNGAHGFGFPSIVGSGINSVILHWMENSHEMKDGDIVVVDCGAEYGLYWADITRTYPVNGKYSKRQREVYEIVLEANKEAIKMIAPGVAFKDVSNRADEVLAEGMVRIGLIEKKSEFKKYYYHGLGHHIGLVNSRGNSLRILEPGMVLTIEPGIYIREESLGVRIEDDVLVTETGHEVLSKAAPKEIVEIEKMMSIEGLDYKKFLVK